MKLSCSKQNKHKHEQNRNKILKCSEQNRNKTLRRVCNKYTGSLWCGRGVQATQSAKPTTAHKKQTTTSASMNMKFSRENSTCYARMEGVNR
jgi:hypothetical protein